MSLLTVENLSLARGGFPLFSELSFRVAAGEHAALVGPNGAGKTSLLRAIAGFLPARTGRVAFPEGGEAADFAHYVGHRDGLKGSLSVLAHVRHWAALFGGDRSAEDALARVGLGPLADLPARALSAGQSRRLALTRLLVAPRPLWLLDEPTASLDVAGKALAADLIAEHRAGGGAALVATHEALGAPSQTIALGLGR